MNNDMKLCTCNEYNMLHLVFVTYIAVKLIELYTIIFWKAIPSKRIIIAQTINSVCVIKDQI